MFNAPIVLLSDDEAADSEDYSNSVRARLAANATASEAMSAVVAAAEGFFVLTEAQARRILPARRAPRDLPRLVEALTPREVEVLRFMGDGLLNKEIAERLGISEHTVKFHVASILGKLGAGSRTEAVAQGMRRGLIPI
jgi:DNA-binding NarL/FixJ family response regulator